MYKLGFSYAFGHETITTTKTLNKSIFLFPFVPLCSPPFTSLPQGWDMKYG